MPAQKNVLTNYFCFASLEAKRKFRAPRVSPKNSDSGDDFSPALMKQVCGSNNVPSHDSAIQQIRNGFSLKEIEDNDSPVEGSLGQNLLEQSRHSIHKPCLQKRKGHDDEHGSWVVSEKEDLQELHSTIKSSSFQHNSSCESDPSHEINKVPLKRSYFLDEPDDNDLLGKSKKVVIKSSYFKHKSKTTGSYVNERCLVKDNSSIDGDISEKFVPEMPSVGNNFDEDLCINIKASSSLDPKEHAECKDALTDAYVEAKCVDLSTEGDKPIDVTPAEEKFGCKISHLGHYSDISGKSMEKFVSVISTFSFASSGSRASGLRAPLRDVKNIDPNRSPAASDIGKFSYVPKSEKIKVKRASLQRQ